MPSSCRMALLLLPLLLLLLLLWTGTWAQSGDGGAEAEPRISCTSDITLERNNLTCELLGGPNHDEDDEDSQSEGIEKMSVCYIDYAAATQKCEESLGNSISLMMPPISDFTLSAHLIGGGSIKAKLNLQKIVKPRSPVVHNISFNLDSNQAVIYIQTPYHNDYLKTDNQLFQLHICTTGSEMTQNVSASDHMKIDMQSLHRDAEYRVRVRAIPINHLQGSWSEWSDTFSFTSPAAERPDAYVLVLCLVSLVVVSVSAGFLWKNKIFTYMWPSIPHPKRTLVQICKPNKGLLLSFSPEVFSALKVYPVKAADEEAAEEMQPALPPAVAEQPSSTQSSDCRSTTSVSTEELELSRSCSDGEESVQSSSPSPVNVLPLWDGHDRSGGGNQLEALGAGQQEEAYVTMSSFYQIK
ncbi:interleukin-7 receptor subunit alpha [Betta splendens]|uniref:Interleukin-7 receptor subunit alpha n=1 Tax=Betta splendens TaxID=158456 RepID=A0A6P7NZN2_BETSP|nr:interleukin-7 receptor subunit alpha [Betta splendens]